MRRLGQSARSLLPAVGIVLVTASCGVRPAPSARPPAKPPGSVARVFGVVTASPACPVERPGHACAPRPVGHVRVEARNLRTGLTVSTGTSGGGHYSLRLGKGRYVLSVAATKVFPRCPEVIVAVASLAPVRANLQCDSGIR